MKDALISLGRKKKIIMEPEGGRDLGGRMEEEGKGGVRSHMGDKRETQRVKRMNRNMQQCGVGAGEPQECPRLPHSRE